MKDNFCLKQCNYALSLPSRERGLKYELRSNPYPLRPVAPFAGAWIEILPICQAFIIQIVAPFAGAWIEMPFRNFVAVINYVAPFAGAWIEI